MKKQIHLINMVLISLILVLAVAILLTAALSRYKNELPALMGYSLHIVITDSMSPDIEEGDFVIARRMDISEAKIGDYVVFNSPDPELKGMVIIHSVVAEGEDEQGRYLTTAGVKQGAPLDRYPVRNISGIYVWSSTFLGKVFGFMSDFKNLLFISVTIGAMFVVVKYSVKIAVQLKKKDSNGEA